MTNSVNFQSPNSYTPFDPCSTGKIECPPSTVDTQHIVEFAEKTIEKTASEINSLYDKLWYFTDFVFPIGRVTYYATVILAGHMDLGAHEGSQIKEDCKKIRDSKLYQGA